MVAGERVDIGRSSSKQLTRRPFTEACADFPRRRTYLTLDVGLVEIAIQVTGPDESASVLR